MEWNPFNSLILVAVSSLILFCFSRILSNKSDRTTSLMLWFILFSNLVILQVILIDIGITKAAPLLLLFYMPLQFLCPVIFIAFTYSYLDAYYRFKKIRILLSIPFMCFFVLYIVLKINVVQEYSLISKPLALWIGTELDENSALLFSLFSAVWNYCVIRDYETNLGQLPYALVIKKTKWLKYVFLTMTLLCLLWALVIIYLKVDDSVSGHGPYYPLWLLFVLFYTVILFSGYAHLKEVDDKKSKEKRLLQTVNHNFDIKNLRTLFNSDALLSIQESTYRVTEILEYFATSLFDKHTENEVLWDIVKNCISKLNLEDCVIYTFDKKSNTLLQRAAYGNKDKGNRRIVDPITIPLGEGIVGTVGKTGHWELVGNIDVDQRYIMDDVRRKSELAVPIAYENIIIGVLDSENSARDFFTKKHIFLFQLIAKLTAIKLMQIKKDKEVVLTQDNVHFKRLKHWLETEKSFLNPQLSLQMSSDYLKISSGYLSQIINTLSGTNFSEFINLYRVEESKKLLLDPEFSKYAIVAIGLEAGFNSKSAFYTAFKKIVGATPTEYRQRYKMVS